MNCTETRQAIDQMPTLSVPQGSVSEHIDTCELCQHYYSDRMLEQELSKLQMPDPSPEFLASAFKQAAEQTATPSVPRKSAGWGWPRAAAASVLLAAIGGLSLWDFAQDETVPASELYQAENQFDRREVRVVIYSEQDRDHAELSIELAEDLELEGYAGTRRLAWNTKLSKGANVLTMPVLVRNNGGEVRITSSFADANHEVTVQVAKRDSSAQLEAWDRDLDNLG